MPATQAATKLQTEATPLATAQTEQLAARAEVEGLTVQIKHLMQDGPSFDKAEHGRLEAAREAGLKRLRHADLAVRERGEANYSPLSDRTVQKIREQRRKVWDLHPALMGRLAESRGLRERRQGLRNAIEELQSSPQYLHDRQEVLRRLNLHDDVTEELSAGGIKLAALELDLARTSAEFEITTQAFTEAQARWQNAKTCLESWEEAIRAMGPAAQRALAAIPKPGASDDDPLVGYADLQSGPGQMPHDLHESAKKFGRKEVF